MKGLTLDTGALFAIEKGDLRTLALLESATERGQLITVPSPVIVEWWRGQRGPVAKLLEDFVVEELSSSLAHIAGEALARCSKGAARTIKAGRKGPSPTDAVVMASAAQRADIVLTGDLADLALLRDRVFRDVRLLRV